MSRFIPFRALAAVPDECRSSSLPIPLHDAVAPTRRQHRSLIAAAGQWAMANGVPLPADHVALWAATVEAAGNPVDVNGVTGPWRASAMSDGLATIAAWCTLAGCALPAELTESLWHLYGFLSATHRLHPASDSLTELRAALVVFAAFDRGRPLSPQPPEPTAA